MRKWHSECNHAAKRYLPPSSAAIKQRSFQNKSYGCHLNSKIQDLKNPTCSVVVWTQFMRIYLPWLRQCLCASFNWAILNREPTLKFGGFDVHHRMTSWVKFQLIRRKRIIFCYVPSHGYSSIHIEMHRRDRDKLEEMNVDSDFFSAALSHIKHLPIGTIRYLQ